MVNDIMTTLIPSNVDEFLKILSTVFVLILTGNARILILPSFLGKQPLFIVDIVSKYPSTQSRKLFKKHY